MYTSVSKLMHLLAVLSWFVSGNILAISRLAMHGQHATDGNTLLLLTSMQLL